MDFITKIDSTNYLIDTDLFYDISIGITLESTDSKAVQPNSFGVEYASSKPYTSGNFIGDTRKGSSVNFEKISIIPHCNCTHTECIGHLTDQRVNLNDHKRSFFSLANLISVKLTAAKDSSETYSSKLHYSDLLITKSELQKIIHEIDINYKSLIIRTLPNPESKKYKSYNDSNAAFFTKEAMEFISDLNLDNLIVDLPSIDKANDEGKLSNHRIWWGLEPQEKKLNGNPKNLRTITEFAYIESHVKDDIYILNLQSVNFSGDAVPSRPILYPIKNEKII